MSLLLERSGGIDVSTHFGWAATKAGPFHAFWLWGGEKRVEVPLSVATTAIKEVVDGSSSDEDAAMRGLQQYMRSLHVTEEDELGRDGKKISHISPDELGRRALMGAFDSAGSAETQEPVEFLGNKIAKADFIGLVDYVMTNTPLWLEMPTDTEDPRISMIQAIRGGN